MNEKPSTILNELKRLYAKDAPLFSLLKTWITELWNDKSSSSTIEQDTLVVSNDLPIEIHSKDKLEKKIEMRFDLFRSKSKNPLMQLKLKEVLEKVKNDLF